MPAFQEQMTKQENRLPRLEKDLEEGELRLQRPSSLQCSMKDAWQRMGEMFNDHPLIPVLESRARGWLPLWLVAMWNRVQRLMGREPSPRDGDRPARRLPNWPVLMPRDEKASKKLRKAWLRRFAQLEKEIPVLSHAAKQRERESETLHGELSQYEKRLERAREFRVVLEGGSPRSFRKKILDVVRTRRLSDYWHPPQPERQAQSFRVVKMDDLLKESPADLSPAQEKLKVEGQRAADERQELLDKLEAIAQRICTEVD